MKRILLPLFTLLLTATTAFADPLDSFKELKGTLHIAGGTAHIPVMKSAAKNIMETNKDIRITVAAGGSGVGVQKVGEGLVHIGNTGRALKQTEIEKYGLRTFPFALDGVAVVVHPQNPVHSLTKEQLSGIFSGKITNWKELGGNDTAITLYVREDGSGTRETFEERALNKTPVATRSNVLNSNGAMKVSVSQDKNALGYIGIGHLDKTTQPVTIDGMTPSQENASNGSYTITRLLYMNTKGEPQELTRAFIDYIYSSEGKVVVSRAGYIPVDKPE